jgi:cytochrome c5
VSVRILTVIACACLLHGCGEKSPPHDKAATSRVAPPVAAVSLDDGRRVFEHWCLPCHAAGSGHPGTNRLAERLGPESAVLLERDNLNEVYVETVVRNGFQMMPPFRTTEISDDELKSVSRYVATGGGRRVAQGMTP